jgi:macrolide transport system ATP-binding/permease protein
MRIEHWLFTARLRVRSVLKRRRVEQELDEELLFHFENKVEEGIAAGLTPAEARFRALRAMGGLSQQKHEMRDAQRVRWLTDFLDDVAYALRSLQRSPALAAFIVLTLAVGIGMTATPFSMLDALMFRPYPVPRPHDVVTIVSTSRDNTLDSFSYREYLDIRDGTASYDGVVASRAMGAVGYSATPGTTPRVKAGMLVSGNFFDVLGVVPQLGRTFREDEDTVSERDAVTVLGPGFWKNELGGDRSVVGRVIRLNGVDFTVIGVAPDSFPGLQIFGAPDFYVPLAMARSFSMDPRKDLLEDRAARELVVRGRLKRGTSISAARAEIALLARRLEREHPKETRGRGANVHTFFEMRTRVDKNWKFAVIFTGLALAVLLVACTNVAGLLLSRARTRTREIAVRLALGASRSRVIRLLLTESLILAALGGLVGVAVAYAGIGFLQGFKIPSELPVTVPFRLDGRVLLAAVGLSVVSALLSGLAPALQGTRADLVNGLKTADVDVPDRRRLWGRNLLVVAQVSMSLMLLAAAFFMTRGFQQSLDEGTEFARGRVLIARFDPRLVQYDAARTASFYDRLVERARGAAGVESAALAQGLPLGLDAFASLPFVPEGMEMPRDRERVTALSDIDGDRYFETIGIPIVRGRGILPSDAADAPRVAVVNEQLAKHYWPGGDALGKRIRLGGAAGEAVAIVGIARTVKYTGTTEKPTDFVYLPLAQRPAARMLLLLETSGDPLTMVEPLKEIVRTLDPNMPVVQTRSYEELYRYHAVEGPGVAIQLVGVMGLAGLFLTVAGLYGVVAYNVTRRTREIGIRMAIGASPSDVMRLMMGKGLLLVAVGTVLGLAMGAAVEQVMNAMLFNAGGVDPVPYLVVVPSLFVVTLLATWVPARRAAKIAPTRALRYE